MGDFPSGPVVRTPTAGGAGSIPGRGTKIPHAAWRGQKNEKKTPKQGNLFHICEHLKTKNSQQGQGNTKFRGPRHLIGAPTTCYWTLNSWLAVDLES